MNAEVFAEWLRRQKHPVFRSESSYWVDTGADVLQAFPYHWIIQPAEGELKKLFRETRSIAVRYSTPIDRPLGRISYHVVCEDKGFAMTSLNRQARQNVQRGLKYACIEPIPLKRLANEGWSLRRETLIRQCRKTIENEKWWRTLCLSAQDLPGFEAWGAIYQNQLVASFLALRCDHSYSFLYEQSSTAHLEFRVNNALYFEATRQALQNENVTFAFYGLNSLDAPPTIDEFKFRMGLKPKPVRQLVVFNPWLEPFVNPTVHGMVSAALRHSPENYFLAKAEGMLRYHIQGKLPLNEQDWPECLFDQKPGISQG